MTGYHRSDAAQHALVSLTALVSRLLSPTPGVGGLFAPAPAAEKGFDTAPAVLVVLAPYVKHHRTLATGLRAELASVLSALLEWVTADFSRVQNARFVHELLVCLITSHVPQTEGDALASAELMLMHARNLIYHARGELVHNNVAYLFPLPFLMCLLIVINDAVDYHSLVICKRLWLMSSVTITSQISSFQQLFLYE